jgi:hypothetical protein
MKPRVVTLGSQSPARRRAIMHWLTRVGLTIPDGTQMSWWCFRAPATRKDP